MAHRPWTRLGVLGMAGHLAYELVAGVGVPLAPWVGVRTATTGYAALSAAAYRAAGRLPSPRGDRAFAAANGFFLAAVLAHFTCWPRTTRAGLLPWLRHQQRSEYERLLAQAAREPRWWNRRLVAQ